MGNNDVADDVSKHGICHLCGSNGKLSFELVPPEAAFNDQRVLEADILCQKVPPGTTVTIQCSIRPLDVIKQVLVMFCSASPSSFAQKHPRLVRYLLNPESREADDQRVFISLYDAVNSKAVRQAGLTGRIDMGGQSHVFSEISFPPFNFDVIPGRTRDGRTLAY